MTGPGRPKTPLTSGLMLMLTMYAKNVMAIPRHPLAQIRKVVDMATEQKGSAKAHDIGQAIPRRVGARQLSRG